LLIYWLFGLNAAPLFDVDEGAFAEATREMLTSGDFGHTTLNGADRFDKPILVYWLQAAAMSAFGINEFAARLPSAVCAWAWSLALAAFALPRYGKDVALAAAIIFSTSIGPMLIGRAATADALLNLLLTLATLDLWRFIESEQRVALRRAFLWIGLGLLAKGPIAVLVPGSAVALYLIFSGTFQSAWRSAWAMLRDLPSWLIIILVALPWYAYAISRHGPAFIDGFILRHNVERFSGPLQGHSGSMFYYLLVLPLVILPWTPLLFAMLTKLRPLWRDPLSRFLLLWAAFVVGFFSFSGTKLPHYVLYGLSPLVLLLARHLCAARARVHVAIWVAVAFVVAAGFASPWIAAALVERTNEPLANALLQDAAAREFPGVMLLALVTTTVLTIRAVARTSASNTTLLAAGACSVWFVFALVPWWGEVLQSKVRALALASKAQRATIVQWKLHHPSFAFYRQRIAPLRPPTGNEWALTRLDRLSEAERGEWRIEQQAGLWVIVRRSAAAQ
jgi:4-amino-4-deoxy-L-arabinose transferase-like glycosyltransferase